jgi:hypothetical protein
VTEKVAHRPSRGVDRRFAERRFDEAAGIEPSAVRAGELALEIGDRRDHRRPSLGRAVFIGSVVAARMKAQRAGSAQIRNTAVSEMRFYESAQDRLRHGEKPPRGLR